MKKLMACLLAFLMILTVAPLTASADTSAQKTLAVIQVNNADLKLNTGVAPQFTSTLDASLAGKVELFSRGWVYLPDGYPPKPIPDAEEGGAGSMDFYYLFENNKINHLFHPDRMINRIVAGRKYYYHMVFLIRDVDAYDFDDSISIRVGMKTYTAPTAIINVGHRIAFNDKFYDDPEAPTVPMNILEVLIPVTATVPRNGWQKSGSNQWVYYKNDVMQKGWLKEKGIWYYLTPQMATFWKKIGGKWYYFNSSGAMQTGWLKVGGKWYCFNSSGAMLTGWQKIGGKWYYFNSAGDMKTGWLKDGGKWYYLESSGAMAVGKTLKIGGKTYRFNASGVCTNP